MWRLVISPRLNASLVEIERDWTLADVLDAHTALDVCEDLEILVGDAMREG